jgi:phosphatidylserine/phosphatidylglycerophosphate/cardiolipin synthase-like enzyme
MEILKTPWKENLLQLVADSRESIKVTSPFVKTDICAEIFNSKQLDSSFELITSFKLANIHNGSLDLAALNLILDKNGIVKNHSRLHAKIYIFDDKKAIITSGNLTFGGLIKNFEYGILVDDRHLVAQISHDFNALSNAEITGKIKKTDLEIAKNILSEIPKNASTKFPKIDFDTPEDFFDIIEIDKESINKNLKGWKLDVYKCLDTIEKQIFSLSDIYAFEPYFRQLHPNNNNINDKIRQTLQILRDFGLIEFLGYGNYKKLWR